MLFKLNVNSFIQINTNIALNPSDAAIIMFNDSNDKWEDNNVFGTNRNELQVDGGTF